MSELVIYWVFGSFGGDLQGWYVELSGLNDSSFSLSRARLVHLIPFMWSR